jgi:hypothetical protein
MQKSQGYEISDTMFRVYASFTQFVLTVNKLTLTSAA